MARQTWRCAPQLSARIKAASAAFGKCYRAMPTSCYLWAAASRRGGTAGAVEGSHAVQQWTPLLVSLCPGPLVSLDTFSKLHWGYSRAVSCLPCLLPLITPVCGLQALPGDSLVTPSSLCPFYKCLSQRLLCLSYCLGICFSEDLS